MKKLFSIGLMAFWLMACQKMQENGTQDVAEASDTGQADVALRDLYSDSQGKIIKMADTRFEVKNIKQSKEAIENSVRKYGAFISSSNLELQNPMLEEQVTIRVPSDYFDNLLKEITAQATFVNYQKVTTEDVAKQFVDLESRLRTKREVEQRYTEILRSKAGTIEELLKAEQQIGELHEDIEATISRINFLREQVRYSTIKMEMYQVVDRPVTHAREEPGLGQKFSTAFSSGLKGAMELLVAFTYLWPIALLCLAAWMIYRIRKQRMVNG